MAKCSACGSRILFGGQQWGAWPCCDAACLSNLKVRFVDEAMDAAVVAASVDEVFRGACPGCAGPGPVDVYGATSITGMIVAHQIVRRALVGCRSCGRKLRAKAALHCLLLGWWGAHSAMLNLYYLPASLCSALFARSPSAPSSALRRRVKEHLAERSLPELVAAIRVKAEADASRSA